MPDSTLLLRPSDARYERVKRIIPAFEWPVIALDPAHTLTLDLRVGLGRRNLEEMDRFYDLPWPGCSGERPNARPRRRSYTLSSSQRSVRSPNRGISSLTS